MSAADLTPVGGCAECGEVKATHGLKRSPDGTMHGYTAPDADLRRERRAARAQAAANWE